MEDSFRVRVDKAFGALSSTTASLWSLTDDEVEKREWARDSTGRPGDDDNDDVKFPSSFDGFFAKGVEERAPSSTTTTSRDEGRKRLKEDLDELDEEEEEEEEEERGKGKREDEWEMRNSIGMDCTLDFEAEEDDYDKLAVGRENTDERIYMSEVTGYVPHGSSCNELPMSFKRAIRDPRANHSAAKLRLKEDSEAAGKFNSLRVSDVSVTVTTDADTTTALEDGNGHPKSILKRKENQTDLKSEKRVRFDPGCITNEETESKGNEVLRMEEHLNGENKESNPALPLPGVHSAVPDYIQNPSKYTRYSFDSSTDMDDQSNQQAYMDFLNHLKGSKKSDPEDAPADLSKPVVFILKKRDADASSGKKDEGDVREMDIIAGERGKKKILPMVSFADDVAEEEENGMEKDGSRVESAPFGEKKPAVRRSRSKIISE